MLLMASIGATIIILLLLEKQGKVSLHYWMISGILLSISAWGVWEIIKEITKTFL